MNAKTMTAEDLQAELQISRTHAYRLLRQRRIPGVVRIGACLRVDREAFEAWYRSQILPARDQSPEADRLAPTGLRRVM